MPVKLLLLLVALAASKYSVTAVTVTVEAPAGSCQQTPIQRFAPKFAECLNAAGAPGVPTTSSWLVHFGSDRTGDNPFIWYPNSYASSGLDYANVCQGVASDGSNGATIVQGSDLNYYAYTASCCPSSGSGCDAASGCKLFASKSEVVIASSGGIPIYKVNEWTSTSPCGCETCTPRAAVSSGGSTEAVLFQGDSAFDFDYCGGSYVAVAEIQAGSDAISFNFKNNIVGCSTCGALSFKGSAGEFTSLIRQFGITGVGSARSLGAGESVACLTGGAVTIGALSNLSIPGGLDATDQNNYIDTSTPFCKKCARRCSKPRPTRCGQRCKTTCGL